MPISSWSGRLATVGATGNELLAIRAAYGLMPSSSQAAPSR